MDTPIQPYPTFVSTMQAGDRIDAARTPVIVANDEKRILMQIARGYRSNAGFFTRSFIGPSTVMPSSYVLPGCQVTEPLTILLFLIWD